MQHCYYKLEICRTYISITGCQASTPLEEGGAHFVREKLFDGASMHLKANHLQNRYIKKLKRLSGCSKNTC